MNTKLNNKGVSIVEMVVVIAILVVLTGISIPALTHLNRAEIKKAVKTVKSSITEQRVNSMAKTDEWLWELQNDGTNINIVVSIYDKASASYIQVDTTKLDAKVTSITINGNPLTSLTFKKNTGAVDAVNGTKVTSGVGTIAITCSGNVRELKLYYLTGKVE